MAEYKGKLFKGLFTRSKDVLSDDNTCPFDFSTTEHVVGKWIDGSTLYERIIDCGTLVNNATKVIPTGLSNITVREIYGTMWVGQYANAQSMECLAGIEGSLIYYAHVYYSAGNVYYVTTLNTSEYVGFVTLRYTKNT